jgi:hypothetical protein
VQGKRSPNISQYYYRGKIYLIKLFWKNSAKFSTFFR